MVVQWTDIRLSCGCSSRHGPFGDRPLPNGTFLGEKSVNFPMFHRKTADRGRTKWGLDRAIFFFVSHVSRFTSRLPSEFSAHVKAFGRARSPSGPHPMRMAVAQGTELPPPKPRRTCGRKKSALENYVGADILLRVPNGVVCRLFSGQDIGRE